MKGALNGLLAVGSLLLGAGSFYLYTTGEGSPLWLAALVIFVILFLVFGGMFLAGRVNKTEEIHITE